MAKYNIYTYSDNNFIICKYTNIDFLINKSGIRNIISIIITTRNINDACIFFKKILCKNSDRNECSTIFVYCRENIINVLQWFTYNDILFIPIETLDEIIDLSLIYKMRHIKKTRATLVKKFTLTEKHIIDLYLKGFTNNMVSISTGLKPVTISIYKRNIIKKINVRNEIEMLCKMQLLKNIT